MKSMKAYLARARLLGAQEIVDVLEARQEKVKATRAPKAPVTEGNIMEATLPPWGLGDVLEAVERLETELLAAGSLDALEAVKVVHYWLTKVDDD